jgi:hypothetical protein
VAGFVVGGAGLALLGAAVGTGLVLPSKQRTVDQCRRPSGSAEIGGVLVHIGGCG